ncbi:glycosyltransferase [Kurthia senegalensis]|uniref:glycosyltransferase n=1 Tax=Kurthia senegalensis TaxID=1033740 RepID=UPI000288DFBE|nr:glycosyltransferase [Kurthia senegalensis]
MVHKLAYIYDLKMPFDGTSFYSKNFPNATWEKYESFAEEIHIFPYKQEVEQTNLNKVTHPQVHFHPLPFPTTKSLYRHLQKVRSYCRELVKAYDYFVIRLPSHLGLFVGYECIRQSKPYLIETVGNAFEAFYYHGNLLYKIAAPILDRRMKHVIRHAKTAIYVTNNYLQRCYPSENTFEVSNATIQLQQKVSRTNTITLGMIGSLNVDFKGHQTLYEALKLLDDQGYAFTVRLLGEGQYKNELSYRQIDVIHDGLLNKEALQKWYEQLTIYVQPSITEANSRSIIEAMSFGIPVVGSTAGGTPELIEEDLLFPVRDAQQFMEKIRLLLDDSQKWEQAAQRNHDFATKYLPKNVEKARKEAFDHYMN